MPTGSHNDIASPFVPCSYTKSLPSTLTTTELQSATKTTEISRSRESSTSTVTDENQFDSDSPQFDSNDSIQENISTKSPLAEINSATRPAHLVFNKMLSASPTRTLINIESDDDDDDSSTHEENYSSPINSQNLSISSLHNYKRSNSESPNATTLKTSPVITSPAPRLTMGNPLLYRVTTDGLGRQILTPILTVLPSINPITTSTLQAGGQSLIFSAPQPSLSPQLLTSSPSFQNNLPQCRDRASSDPSFNLLPSPVELPRGSPNSSSPPRTLASLMLSEMTPQYMELKAFAEDFKTKRIRLGYTQGAVGHSLAQKGYNNFAQSTISRFEQMQLSPANAAAIKQVLEKWLQDAESPDSQSSPSLSSSVSVVPLVNCRKRKKRAVFTAQTRDNLDVFFKQNPRPNRQMIENVADELGLLPEEVRVWFCNKRQKSKQSYSSYDRESSVSTSSYIDSPPSFYDSNKGRSPSPKTPFTIDELSKSSVSMTTSPPQTSPVQLSTLGLVRPLSSTGLYPVMFPSPPRLISSHIAQTTAA